MSYKIQFVKSSIKELKNLETNISRRIIQKIEILSENPKPSGYIKLKGNNNLYRIRIAEYRIIYSIDEVNKIIDIFRIRHRRDVYKFL